MVVNFCKERERVIGRCTDDFLAFLESRFLDEVAELVRDKNSLHQVVEAVWVGSSTALGQKRRKPIADLVILYLIPGRVDVHNKVVVRGKPGDDDRPLRQVPVSRNLRNEKCVDSAAAEHVADGIAGRERICLLEEATEDWRQDEQDACGEVAACTDFSGPYKFVCGKQCDEEKCGVFTVVKQVAPRPCDVCPICAYVKNKSRLDVHDEQYKLEKHKCNREHLGRNRLFTFNIDKIQNIAQPYIRRNGRRQVKNRRRYEKWRSAVKKSTAEDTPNAVLKAKKNGPVGEE